MEYGNGERNHLVWMPIQNKYHNEEFQVTEDNVNVNVAMLGKLIESGDVVLDIGCGEGKLGYVIKDKGCRLIGVDIDTAACYMAQQSGYYEKIFTFNIENWNVKEKGYSKFLAEEIQFDKIALIDILEHVVNPTAVLEHVLQYLKEEGQVLISVPNVNNADIFLNLLRDRFNYQASGVLDNTHTKYFTKRSFLEWIQEINDLRDFSLDCEYVGSTFGYTNYMESVKQNYSNVYKFLQLNPYFHSIQHLFRLTYYKSKKVKNLLKLNELLAEDVPDLTGAFECLLSNGEFTEGKMPKITMLPNERSILEAERQSAEVGWEKCSDALRVAKEKIHEQENALKEAGSKIFEQEKALREASGKITEQERVLDDANRKMTEQERALKDVNRKITEQENALKIASGKISEQENALKIASGKISEQENALKIASGKISEQEDALKDANRKISEQENTLTDANVKIIEQNSALKIAKEKIEEQSQIIVISRKKMDEKDFALESAAHKLKEQENTLKDAKQYQEKLHCDIQNLKKDMVKLQEEKRSILEKWKECADALAIANSNK